MRKFLPWLAVYCVGALPLAAGPVYGVQVFVKKLDRFRMGPEGIGLTVFDSSMATGGSGTTREEPKGFPSFYLTKANEKVIEVRYSNVSISRDVRTFELTVISKGEWKIEVQDAERVLVDSRPVPKLPYNVPAGDHHVTILERLEKK